MILSNNSTIEWTIARFVTEGKRPSFKKHIDNLHILRYILTQATKTAFIFLFHYCTKCAIIKGGGYIEKWINC